ncbi:MAG: alpha-2-macroglobulin family protein [Hahellaceae bacterium]|nr:alpha-2-macroglobulin family protein [Hahellaceae bacterium]
MNARIFICFIYLTLLFTASGCREEDASSPSDSGQSQAPATQSNTIASPDELKKRFAGVELKVLDISERQWQGKNALAVTLSVPLDPALPLHQYLNVSSHQGGLVEGAWVLSDDQRVLYFPQTDPQTTYDISVFNGLPALTGVTLAQQVQQQITTQDVQPAIGFASNGSVLPMRLTSGLPVSVMNVDEVDINFHRIHPDKIHAFLKAMDDSYDHRFYQFESLQHWGTLAYSGRFSLKPPKNTLTQLSIPVEDIIQLQEPGLYVAVMDEPGSYDYQRQVTHYMVTDIGLHARRYEKQLVLEAASLKSAQPLAGVRLSVYKKDGALVQEMKTSPQGEASFLNLPNDVSYLLAYKDQQISMLDLNGPALDLSAFDLGMRPTRPQELFIYTPRDLFRPGESVDFHALLRDSDGQMVPAQTLNTRVRRPDGQVVQERLLPAQSLNYYHQQFTLPSNAPTGLWHYEVSNVLRGVQQYPFQVEDFLPERMTLSFNHDTVAPLQFLRTERVSIPVTGRYLYGAPAAGNRLSTEASLSLLRKPLAQYPDYLFGNELESVRDQFTPDDVLLDDAGEGVVQMDSRWSQLNSPLQLLLSSSLYESGGRPVTRHYRATIWPEAPQYGVRPSFAERKSEANSIVSFDVILANRQGQLLPAEQAEIRLIREDRQYYWKYSDSEGWHYDYTEKEFAVSSQLVPLNASTDNHFSFPVDWGRYRLEVATPGSAQKTTVRFFAGEDWYARWEESQQTQRSVRPDVVTLALDKAAYAGGDTATLQINSPHAGEAMVLVESDHLLWSQHITLLNPQGTVSIPVSSDWHQHDIYVSVVVLRPALTHDNGDRPQTPKRAFGLIHLPLDRSGRHLQVTLTTAEKNLPESTMVSEIKVTDAQGTPLSEGYVSLSAVDVGVLNITRFETPDPFEGFFGQRRYQPDSYDLYGKLIELHQNTKARLRFGGDADLSRGGQAPQSDVQIVSLTHPLVKLDAEGKAKVALDLPYFNGKLRIMAVAFGATAFASAEAETTVAAPVVTQMNLPRFLAMGDQSGGVLDLHNLSGQSQSLRVSIQTGQGLASTVVTHTLSMANEAKTQVAFPLLADAPQSGSVSVTIEGDELATLNRQWMLGIRPAYPAEVRQWQTTLAPPAPQTATETSDPARALLPQSLSEGLHTGTTEARLTLTNRADFKLSSQLSHLLRYPYGCLEQTSSTAYPYAFATPAVQQQFGMAEVTDVERATRINAALTRIAGMQKSNGGFGLWDQNADEEHWLTAYATDFMLNVRDQGFSVPPQLLEKALNRLKDYVNRPGSLYEQHYSDNIKHYRFAYRSYAAYVLARVNQISLSSLRTLYDRQRQDAKAPLPLVHLGLALIQAGDLQRGSKALTAAEQTRRAENQYLGEYGSDIRDQAMMIYLLLKHQQHQAQAFERSFELAKAVQSRRWLSTQERNALFLAGLQLETQSHTPWRAELAWAGQTPESLQQTAALLRKISGETLAQGGRLSNQGNGRLFASLEVIGYPIDKPAPVAENYEIIRNYFDSTGRAINHLSEVRSGDLVLVGLEIRHRVRSPDTLVIDMLPAGFELENPNLPDGVKTDTLSIDGTAIPTLQQYTRIKHQEYRDDRYVAAIDADWGAQRLFYLMRAVTPGTYRVPPPYVEDMYRPEHRAIGETLDQLIVTPR